MSEVSIQVTIAGRPYPLTVSENDAERIQACAVQINDFVQQFGRDFSVSDKQDLLAMAALHLTSQVEPDHSIAINGLEEIRSLIGDAE